MLVHVRLGVEMRLTARHNTFIDFNVTRTFSNKGERLWRTKAAQSRVPHNTNLGAHFNFLDRFLRLQLNSEQRSSSKTLAINGC